MKLSFYSSIALVAIAARTTLAEDVYEDFDLAQSNFEESFGNTAAFYSQVDSQASTLVGAEAENEGELEAWSVDEDGT